MYHRPTEGSKLSRPRWLVICLKSITRVFANLLWTCNGLVVDLLRGNWCNGLDFGPYPDGLSACEQSPIQVVTGPSVD